MSYFFSAGFLWALGIVSGIAAAGIGLVAVLAALSIPETLRRLKRSRERRRQLGLDALVTLMRRKGGRKEPVSFDFPQQDRPEGGTCG